MQWVSRLRKLCLGECRQEERDQRVKHKVAPPHIRPPHPTLEDLVVRSFLRNQPRRWKSDPEIDEKR